MYVRRNNVFDIKGTEIALSDAKSKVNVKFLLSLPKMKNAAWPTQRIKVAKDKK